MTNGQKIMSWEQRIRLEEKLRYKVPIAQIARELGFSRRTIYNEIKRGTYYHTEDYRDVKRYSAEKGQDIHEKGRQRNTGRGLKIGKDRALAAFLEDKMLREKYSPAVALDLARREGFKTSICVQTLYNYIDKSDKTERQTVLETVRRSAFLCICYQSTDLIPYFDADLWIERCHKENAIFLRTCPSKSRNRP